MDRRSKAANHEKAPVVLRRLFDEHKTTLRAVSARTREIDETGKGIDFTYISGLVTGREVPSPRALELLAGVFGIAPEFFIEYRILKLRGELDLRANGSDAAIERYLTVTGEGTR